MSSSECRRRKAGGEEAEMKIVTYNVNGLRQRVSQHGSLLKLLNSFDADIICFQETKLQRQDLSVDVTMAEGYEAFVSCTRTSSKGRLGYSGVATFCRVSSAFSTKEVALPVAAEEGFTGLLESSKRQETVVRDLCIEKTLDAEGIEHMTKEDLLKVDSEGRCIITDHGHFVLFNLYGPRADCDDKERTHFKFMFYKLLQRRWESLLTHGRRVVVAGDLNIAPFAIDRCDAEPEFEKNMFRTWLRSMLREFGGPFVDVFRSKHPCREGAYTCFSPCIGAEEFNYGSRIDHILIAGPCIHENHASEKHKLFDCHVGGSDIMIQFIRGNFVGRPKWLGGRSIKLEGSDHVPVYMILNDIPNLPEHSTPPLAVRYVPEVHGWQQTIGTVFRFHYTWTPFGTTAGARCGEKMWARVVWVPSAARPYNIRKMEISRYPRFRSRLRIPTSRRIPAHSRLSTSRGSRVKRSLSNILHYHNQDAFCIQHYNSESFSLISYYSSLQLRTNTPQISDKQSICTVPFLRKRNLPDVNEHSSLPEILTDDNVASENGGEASVAGLDNNMYLKRKKTSISTHFSLNLDQTNPQTVDHKLSKDICTDINKSCAHKMKVPVKKIRCTEYSQLTLMSYFQKPKANFDCGVERKNSDESLDTYHNGTSFPDVEDQADTCPSSSSKTENRNVALLEWQRIQQKMKMSIPLCKGHGEPCVARSVKKKGPNIGRRFYICARAQGPAANPEANCDHFEWSGKRSPCMN